MMNTDKTADPRKLTDAEKQANWQTDLEKMRQGICPACDIKVEKHSKTKRYVCMEIVRARHGYSNPIINIDGQDIEVDAKPFWRAKT